LVTSFGACAAHPATEATRAVEDDAGDRSDAGLATSVDDDAASEDAGASGSRCTATSTEVDCTFQQLTLTTAGVQRVVDWQVPSGAPPAAGWPVALLFQGSLFGIQGFFAAQSTDTFGAYYEALTTKALLDAGYAVLVPEALGSGLLYWDTNVPPYATNWSAAPDDAFMDAIFEAMAEGRLGRLDTTRQFAAGISSGGYMTSRMAVSYGGKFRALAIHSGSYATCAGAVCTVPAPLPLDHPPTLFLHGAADTVVPIATMYSYDDQLLAQAKPTRVVIDPNAGHQWIAAAPSEIVTWFKENDR